VAGQCRQDTVNGEVHDRSGIDGPWPRAWSYSLSDVKLVELLMEQPSELSIHERLYKKHLTIWRSCLDRSLYSPVSLVMHAAALSTRISLSVHSLRSTGKNTIAAYTGWPTK